MFLCSFCPFTNFHMENDVRAQYQNTKQKFKVEHGMYRAFVDCVSFCFGIPMPHKSSLNFALVQKKLKKEKKISTVRFLWFANQTYWTRAAHDFNTFTTQRKRLRYTNVKKEIWKPEEKYIPRSYLKVSSKSKETRREMKKKTVNWCVFITKLGSVCVWFCFCFS